MGGGREGGRSGMREGGRRRGDEERGGRWEVHEGTQAGGADLLPPKSLGPNETGVCTLWLVRRENQGGALLLSCQDRGAQGLLSTYAET